MKRMGALMSCLCAAVWTPLLLAGMPPIARALKDEPTTRRWHVTSTLDAIARIRAARRRGEPTLLVAGSSLTRDLRADALTERGVAAITYVPGSELTIVRDHALMLIDYADPDVLVVPLVWPTFLDPPDSLLGRNRLAIFGFGTSWGLLRQAQWLVRENVEGLRRATLPAAAPPQGHRRKYRESLDRLAWTLVTPPAASLAELDRVRAYGAARGVDVVYFLSPHNPAYLEAGIVPRESFERFRADMAPYVVADLGALLPAAQCEDDFTHFTESGAPIVAAALRDALAPELARVEGRRPLQPTLAWRATTAARSLARESLAHAATAVASTTELAAHVQREARLQLAQYPAYWAELRE